jgi:hypothetical protein
MNLGRKILVSLAIWYSSGVLIGYHLGDWFIPIHGGITILNSPLLSRKLVVSSSLV